jgi:hypothetical protein
VNLEAFGQSSGRDTQQVTDKKKIDGTAGDSDSLPTQLSPDLACAVNLEVLIIDAPNLVGDLDNAPDLARNRLDRPLLRFVFPLVLKHQPDCPFPNLG